MSGLPGNTILQGICGDLTEHMRQVECLGVDVATSQVGGVVYVFESRLITKKIETSQRGTRTLEAAD